MAETPKDRTELKRALGDLTLTVELIESLGLRIVPAELDAAMLGSATGSDLALIKSAWAIMLSRSPFAPENPNG